MSEEIVDAIPSEEAAASEAVEETTTSGASEETAALEPVEDTSASEPAEEISEEVKENVKPIEDVVAIPVKKSHKKKITDTPPRSPSRASKRLSNQIEGATLSPLISSDNLKKAREGVCYKKNV